MIAASVMGCAVAGMHYTAMRASIFFPLPNPPTYGMALSPTVLALLVTIFAVLIAVSTLVATFAGQQNDLALSLTAEVSHRKRVEEDLRRSEAYLAEAQRLSHIGSWAFSVMTRQFTHSSDEHNRLFGFDPRDGLPAWGNWVQRLHPEDRERTMDNIQQSISQRRDFELDCRIAHPDNTIKYVHVLGHPRINSSGDLVEFLGTSIDTTERKKAEEAHLDAQTKLARANRVTTMGQLAASISHELKQPITATVLNAVVAGRWLDRQPPDVEQVRQALACIVKDSHRAAEVIDRIRALVQKSLPRKDRLEINGAIREVIGLTRGEVVKNNISLNTDFADALPFIQGDRILLQQVMLNLVLNAVEAMGGVTGGARKLLISTREAESGGVLVSVRDSGPGLPPEVLDHIFDSFYTTKPGGMGLGLSICRSIIEAHGGRLWASANLPCGAVFQFTVPTHPDLLA